VHTGTRSTLGKFTRPRPVGALLRHRLFEEMEQARRHPAVWVAGQPGCGKTTLVSTYLAHRRLPCVWYRMHPDDSDPATFFHYFAQALEQTAPRPRTVPLPHLTPEFLPRTPVFSRRYFEHAYARLEAPCALVFDNYEQAESASALHDVMRELVESLPEGIGAIFLSRSEPPAALALARARGDVALVQGENLKLSYEECGDIAELRGVEIDDPGLRQLHARTQGWAAGVVLALEQKLRLGVARELPAGATPQVVFDYFASEIFGRMDAAAQATLLTASLLPEMTAERVAALSGSADAGSVLNELERASYFTLKRSRACDGSVVYQFHPLFREFLMRRAEDTLSPAALTALRRTAGRLLEGDGETADAFALYAGARAWDEASRLALGRAAEFLAQGRGRIVEGWLRALPPAVREACPWAIYWLGMCRLPFDPLEARRHFEEALRSFEHADDAAGLFSAWASIVDSFVYEWGEFAPLDRWIAALDALRGRYPGYPTPEIEARVSAGMFMALMYRQPHRADLPRWAERVEQIVLASPRVETQMLLGNQLVLYHTLCIGDVAKARVLMDAVRPDANLARSSPMAFVLWRCVEAAYYVSIGAPQECLRAVESGMATAEREGLTLMSFFLLFQWAVSRLKMGDAAAAARLLERAKATIAPGRMLDRARYHYLLFLHAYHTGDAAAALENATQAVKLSDAAGAPFWQAYHRLGLAHAQFETGRRREALARLAEARRIGRAAKSTKIAFSCDFALVSFALERGKQRLALPLLRRAMQRSKASGFFNRLLWTQRNLGKVVVAALENSIEVEHARELARRCRLAPTPQALRLDSWPFAVRVCTLGHFRVELDGRPLELNCRAQRKPLELLMALIALGGRGVAELQITDVLWPDADGDAAHQACAIALHRLRKLLACEQAIILRRNELTLDPAHVWVDAWALERALAQPPALGPADERGFTRVCSLYRGPFLRHVESSWATPLRERLRSRFMRHVAQHGRTLLASGQHAAAIDAFESGLDTDGQLEELYHGLMLCHSAMGRRAEAIGVFRRCEKMLSATLGIAPGTKTMALYRMLQRPDCLEGRF
jgi:ATP/maltotriose-dependent transcriptional regulator MalT/DNA-binding SARP family transcriptional activator